MTGKKTNEGTAPMAEVAYRILARAEGAEHQEVKESMASWAAEWTSR